MNIIRQLASGSAIAICIILFNISLSAQLTGGGYANSYLHRDVGARAIGMAGAYTALSNDPLAMFYNPAGLSDLNSAPSFNVMYSSLDFNRYQTTLFYGQKLSEHFAIGGGINTFGSGSFMMRDIRNNAIREISSNDYSFSLGASYNIEFAALGASVKYLSNSLYGVSGNLSGYSVDIGSKFNVMDMFTFGLAIQNLFNHSQYSDGIKEESKIPYTIRTGIAFEIPFGISYEEDTRDTYTGASESRRITSRRYLAVDVDARYMQFQHYPSLIVGMEFAPHSIIAFRAGIEVFGENKSEATFLPMNYWGAGVALKPFISSINLPLSLEYSISSDYLAFQKIGHHVSVNIDF